METPPHRDPSKEGALDPSERGTVPEPETAGGAEGARADAFVADLFAPEDEHLAAIRRVMAERGLPTIQLPRSTARVVQLLLRTIGARRVLEIGTLAGYSALWIARALSPDGRLLTVELDAERARLAAEMLGAAGASDRVEVQVGDAAEVMRGLQDEGEWDAVFLDADKEGLPGYVREAKRLLRPGGLLLVDNALWKGQVADQEADDDATRAIRTALRGVAGDAGFDATLLPVGDGLLVARRVGAPREPGPA